MVRPQLACYGTRVASLRSATSHARSARVIPGLLTNACHCNFSRSFSVQGPRRQDIGDTIRSMRQGEKPVGTESSNELLDLEDVEPVYRSNVKRLTKSYTPEARELSKDFGFLFGCDGVLYNGRNKIEGALSALRAAKWHYIRFMFLADHGGMSPEHEIGEELKDRLRAGKKDRLFKGNVIQSHTPLQFWPQDVKENDVVYITGRKPNNARNLAQAYGFKKVITSADLLEHHEPIYPFDPMKVTGKKGRTKTQTLPDGTRIFRSEDPTEYDTDELRRKNHLKIDHIFVWNDPRDWSLETQLIHDMLISHQGYFGTVSKKNGDITLPNNGWQQDHQPKIWVSNTDFEFKGVYHLNRLGTGAFLEALKGVWSAKTGGKDLQYEYIGKPSNLTYEYAHDQLVRAYARRWREQGLDPPRETDTIQRVYAIGDNPERDIKSVLNFKPEDGTKYIPILVRTGDWKGTGKELEHKPAVIVDDVLDAVIWAMRQEGIDAHRENMDVPRRYQGLVELNEVVKEEDMAERLRLKRQ